MPFKKLTIPEKEKPQISEIKSLLTFEYDLNDEILASRQQLIVDDLSQINKRYHRIIETNPDNFYQLAGKFLLPYNRNNWILREHLFPERNDKICRCGCNQPITGRMRSYATKECVEYVNQVICILSGRTPFIRNVIAALFGDKCFKCNANWQTLSRPNDNDWRSVLELDHILPVHKGGGGCWLSNYQLICYVCHQKKSKKDLEFKK